MVGLTLLAPTFCRRAELKALVDVHGRTAGFGGTLSKEEIHIISGALDLTQKTALESMTPLDRVFMICADDRIDERALHNILLSGHSRIPVHRHGNRKDIIGILLAKVWTICFDLSLICQFLNPPELNFRLFF